MRTLLKALAAAVLILALTPTWTAQAATSSSLNGRFTIFWPKSADAPRNAPCDPGALCGSGSLTAFGPATVTIEDDAFAESDGCLVVERIERVHLLDGTGDLVLEVSGPVCFPGRSGDAADQGSYGNPSRWTLRGRVDGGSSTGVFEGASGAVTDDFSFAGAVGRWRLAGTVSTR
ncbi:MAG: hypothetical protein ABI807_02405 [Sporichthyaceae bacterium]